MQIAINDHDRSDAASFTLGMLRGLAAFLPAAVVALRYRRNVRRGNPFYPNRALTMHHGVTYRETRTFAEPTYR
jgi:hypothetical protein